MTRKPYARLFKDQKTGTWLSGRVKPTSYNEDTPSFVKVILVVGVARVVPSIRQNHVL